MKKIVISGLLLVFFVTTFAQSKTYTMHDAVLGLYTDLRVDNLQHLSWIPNKNTFTKVLDTIPDALMLQVEVPTMKKDTLFRLSEINAHLFPDKALKKLPQLKWIDKHRFYFTRSGSYYLGKNTGGTWEYKKWADLPEGAGEIYIDTTRLQIAYTIENNLSIINIDGETHVITTDSDKEIMNGQVVSRYEMGIEKGAFFSPSGKYLAFYRKDEHAVEDYPIVHWEDSLSYNKNIKYPMAGRGSEEVWLGVYNTEVKTTKFMQTGRNTDHYLTNITWDPSEKYVYIGIVNRAQKHLQLNKYDAQSGAYIKTLFEERDSQYVHPTHPLYFISGVDDEFIWWSQRDGFGHLYRYKTDGELLNQVTKGDWLVNSIDGWNTEKKEIIISTTQVSALNKNIYAVNWETGSIRRLDSDRGMHSANVNSSGTYWIDNYTNYTTPRRITVASTDGDWSEELLDARNPLEDYEQPRVKQLNITSSDGETPLYARLILPSDFDSTAVYPVIVYLYNGPGVQLLHNKFPETGNLWYDYLAQRGYIVFTMDGRGSSNRGVKFEQVTYRNLGKVEMEDQLRGVDYLKSLPYVDASRMGVHGWSYGGFMSISLMLRHPGVFSCAVAGGPVIDWSWYEVMYTERYMDTPQDNPEGYAHARLTDKVKNLEGDLLIIHGAMDSTVVLQHSMRFLHACIQNGVQIDFFTYPVHPHNVRGKDRVHLMQKVTDYFDKHLRK